MKTLFTLIALVAALSLPAQFVVQSSAQAATGVRAAGIQAQEYIYDFAVDGGATGAVTLSSKNGAKALPAGAIVLGVIARVLTAGTSGGSATVAWGNSADVDGYSGTPIAVASLTAGAVFNGAEDGAAPGALIWDVTNEEEKPYAVTSTANTQDFKVTIGTAALTAGKMSFTVLFLFPKGV